MTHLMMIINSFILLKPLHIGYQHSKKEKIAQSTVYHHLRWITEDIQLTLIAVYWTPLQTCSFKINSEVLQYAAINVKL